MTIKLISMDNDFGDVEYFASGGNYVHFFAGDEEVYLDGDFTISDIEIILAALKRHLTQRAADGAVPIPFGEDKMICQKCDKGRVLLGMVFYAQEVGFNTGGEDEFVEYEMGDCPCCNGKFESCQTCGGLTPLAVDEGDSSASPV